MRPEVSIFASAVRTQLWMAWVEGIRATNAVEFEVVFVGNNRPEYTLPDNFRFIYSEAKPAACFEMAARASRGEALLQAADDVVYSSGAVDLMYAAWKDASPQILGIRTDGDCPMVFMASCHYYIDDVDMTAYQNLLGQPSETFPLLPVCGMYSRELYHRLGGADRRFNGMQWELDMYMRMWAHGVKTVFVEGGRCTEHVAVQGQTPTGMRLGNRYWEHDRATILSLYTVNGVVGTKRNDGVLSFGRVISNE